MYFLFGFILAFVIPALYLLKPMELSEKDSERIYQKSIDKLLK